MFCSYIRTRVFVIQRANLEKKCKKPRIAPPKMSENGQFLDLNQEQETVLLEKQPFNYNDVKVLGYPI